MTEQQMRELRRLREAELESELEDFAQQIADQVKSFLLALRAISRGEATGGQAISLLLLEVSQVLLAGGRLGVHGGGERPTQPCQRLLELIRGVVLDDDRHRAETLLEKGLGVVD